MSDAQMLARLESLEGSNRRLRWALIALVLLALGSMFSRPLVSQNATGMLQALEVGELVVRDDQGVVRVRIGGDLPDAVVNGVPLPRAQQVAGILLYDETGAERSGYVTSAPGGDVAITFDTRERQVGLIAASATGGAWARLWGEDGSDWCHFSRG